jgi:hypothetical protein
MAGEKLSNGYVKFVDEFSSSIVRYTWVMHLNNVKGAVFCSCIFYVYDETTKDMLSKVLDWNYWALDSRPDRDAQSVRRLVGPVTQLYKREWGVGGYPKNRIGSPNTRERLNSKRVQEQ